jgi:hypothetical protein
MTAVDKSKAAMTISHGAEVNGAQALASLELLERFYGRRRNSGMTGRAIG